jgi:nickel-dependent lactate racemase
MRIDLTYGESGLAVDLPDEHVTDILHMPRLPEIRDVEAAVTEAIRRPIEAAPLKENASEADSAVIVVSDITRPVPNARILPPLLAELFEAGMKSEDILIIIATGLHRPNTPDELRDMLGEAVIESGCRIENHRARDSDAHLRVGTTRQGTEAWVDARYLAADLKVLTGLVEPHLMAGFSGGRKSVCPGVCSAGTIEAFHRPELMESARAATGNMEHNPVDLEACDIAAVCGGCDCILNVTLDEQRNVTGVFAGDLFAAHAAAVERARQQTTVTIGSKADVVVTTGGGAPLDASFYQGVKGMVAAAPICREGGTIIIAQENAEGVGSAEFGGLLRETDDPHALIKDAVAEDRRAIDLWQIHRLEKLLRDFEIISVSGGLSDDIQRELFVTPADTVEEAVEECIGKCGPDTRIAVIPHGPYVIARAEK